MRILLTLIALAFAGTAFAADLGPVITTTDGCVYYRAADGQYYPAARPVAPASCICGDSCSCAAGACPAKCPVRSASNCATCAGGAGGACAVPQFQGYQFAAPVAGGCSGGSCGVPQRRGFTRR